MAFEFISKLKAPEKGKLKLEDVVREAKKFVPDIDIRWIRYGITHGILKPPVRKGQLAYYDEQYIFIAIEAILLLRDHLMCKLAKMVKIMKANLDKESVLLNQIKKYIEKYVVPGRLPYQDELNKSFFDALEAGASSVNFGKIEESAKAEYNKKMT